MILQVQPNTPPLEITWELLPDDFVLPDDPVENLQQPLLAQALTDALATANLIKPQMLVASNFGLVATVNGQVVVKAPDWLWVPQVFPVAADVIRRSYTPHRDGEPVAVVMEFLSETEAGEYSVRPLYPYGKLYFYERILKVPTYVIFEPQNGLIEVRCLDAERYQVQTPNQKGQVWIPELQLWVGDWFGPRAGTPQPSHWLRFWDQDGNLLLWSSELAEQERQRAEQERQRAEQERQRAEQAEQKLASLQQKLIDQGLDPETFG